jgi:DNA-binding NtrC family response regulator
MPDLDISKILLIDDEPMTLKMLRMLLGTYGYTVIIAASGEQGLKAFRDEGPAIVLTDVRMPGMDGIEVLKELKQMDGRVEVIVMTGHGDMEMAINALQNLASDFINKPVQRHELELALNRAKEKIDLRNQVQESTLKLKEKVAEATAQLSKKCRQLELICQISKQIGEAHSLDSLLGFLRERILIMTTLKDYAILPLDGDREGFIGGEHKRISKKFFRLLLDLDRPHTLVPEEIDQVSTFFSKPLNGERVTALPLMTEDTPTAFALTVQHGDDADDDLRLAHFIFSQAAGAIRRAVLHDEQVSSLRKIAEGQERFGNLVGRHAKMLRMFKLIEDVAETEAAVLIQGENGTGKELVARRIHELSRRRSGPFIAVNCAAFPETLIESELFGFERGAFTGASHSKKGSFEIANGGTIFLDEIAEMRLPGQAKLLRVLQFKEFQKLGSETLTKVDVRVVSATSRDLRQEIVSNRFREDLFYRLNVIPITLPPLRERVTDIPLLATFYIRKLNAVSLKQSSEDLPHDVMQLLMNHDWPGNVRELENVIEHAFILSRGGEIRGADFPNYVRAKGGAVWCRPEGLEEVEKKHLLGVLGKCGGNKIKAARLLKISRSTLYRKLEQYNIFD